MSSTNDSTTEHSSESRCEAELNLDCGKGHWSAANIATMVLGFIIFPVLGLIVLVWTILGNPIQELPKWLRKKWNQIRNSRSATEKWDSDNIVFNEFQQTQFDRIKAIQEKINRQADAFRAFRKEAKRRQYQKEFDDFMASRAKEDRG